MTLRGVPASPGQAIGPSARVIRATPPAPVEVIDPQIECGRAREAAAHVRANLGERAAQANGLARSILELAAFMAEDPTLISGAEHLIRTQQLDAATAVWRAGTDIAAVLQAKGGRTAERASDVVDVRDRIVAHLTGLPAPGVPERDEPFVLIASDLAPSDTATLNPSLVLAIVTAQGGPTSHTAILARELGIPAVVACDGCLELPDGARIAVDGTAGVVHHGGIDEEQFLARPVPAFEYQSPCTTTDGRRVELLANVGDADGAKLAASIGADGIGLFRTEYTFPPNVAPSVAEQAARYGQVFAAFPGKRVVVRTLDAGADKPLAYVASRDEPNPALGVRGYRAMGANLNVLDDQLEAIRIAAGNHTAEVWVMAPMITTPDEAEEFTLRAHRSGLPAAGVMVEVPAAAVRASQLLARTDFASIGTNDLTQYTMAADRTLGELAHLADSWDPAVLSLIRMTAQGGDQQGRPVGVCGEAGSDPALAPVLVGLGVTSLSMSPRAIPAVAAVLSRLSWADCVRVGEIALVATSAVECRTAVRAALPVLEELNL